MPPNRPQVKGKNDSSSRNFGEKATHFKFRMILAKEPPSGLHVIFVDAAECMSLLDVVQNLGLPARLPGYIRTAPAARDGKSDSLTGR